MADAFVSPEKTLTVRPFGPVLLQATADRPISDPEWDAYMVEIERLARARQLPRLGIQYALTQAPSASQRKRVGEVMGEQAFTHFALVSGSTLVRGAVTAISWLQRSKIDVAAFAPSEVRKALTWLSSYEAFEVDVAFKLLSEDAAKVGLTLR